MIPTATDVYGKARTLLGDDEVAGGDLYTNAYLATHLQTAVNAMFRALERAGSQALHRKAYRHLPADVGFLELQNSALVEMARILSIRSKQVARLGPIEGLVFASDGWLVTDANHGLTAGARVYVTGVASGADDFINTDWPVAVVDANSFKLAGTPNRPALNPTYTSGGFWIEGSGEWSLPYRQIDPGQDVGDGGVAGLRAVYDLREDSIRFSPAGQARLLEIRYRMRPENIVATKPNLRVRGSLDYLGYMTAALAALAKGADGEAASLMGVAAGVGRLADIDYGDPGGLLGDLTQEHAEASRQIVGTLRFRSAQRGVRRF